MVRHHGLMRKVIKERMDVFGRRGRGRIGMIDKLKEGRYDLTKRRVEERVGWRS